jgi:hypothetical protein
MAEDMTGYKQLRSNWDYLNSWWNDADFALILAYLLVDDMAAPKCRALMHHLAELRETEVTESMAQACSKSAAVSMMTLAGACALTSATGGLAAAVTLPAMLNLWNPGVGSPIPRDALRSGEGGRRKRRWTACAELQDRFPRLQQLFT